ncbi:MAG: hypothetical protein AAB676_19335, partial [Verrucomicrobiota bacterium]
SVCVARLSAIRQCGQSPSGASGTSGAPQREHFEAVGIAFITQQLRKNRAALHDHSEIVKSLNR